MDPSLPQAVPYGPMGHPGHSGMVIDPMLESLQSAQIPLVTSQRSDTRTDSESGWEAETVPSPSKSGKAQERPTYEDAKYGMVEGPKRGNTNWGKFAVQGIQWASIDNGPQRLFGIIRFLSQQVTRPLPHVALHGICRLL
jgi:hypothetical protein